MGKRRSVTSEEVRLEEGRLKEKARACRGTPDNPKGDVELRKLRKCLKRLQRKRRCLVIRASNAAGKATESDVKPAPKAESQGAA